MNPFTHEFQVDEVSKVISFGGVVFDKFCMVPSAMSAIDFMQCSNTLPTYVRKARAFSDKFGITPAKFRKVFNAIMMRVWVDPIKEHANRFAYNSQAKIQPFIVKKIWSNLETIEQAKKDGIYNIVPWIIEKGEPPQILKEQFGKGVWKKLCKQSMTRNSLIAKGTSRFHFETSIDTAIAMPSYILKRGGNSPISWEESTLWLVKNKLISGKDFTKGKYSVSKDAHKFSHYYTDTKRMASELGRMFSCNWPPAKLEEKHGEYVKLINLKRYSPLPIDCLKGFSVNKVVHKGFTTKLLDSAALVHEEGAVMHHCVGSYTSSVIDGKYLVYSITEDGKRSSTLAFYRYSENDPWLFSQHYGYCNGHITDKHESELKEVLLSLLNKVDEK